MGRALAITRFSVAFLGGALLASGCGDNTTNLVGDDGGMGLDASQPDGGGMGVDSGGMGVDAGQLDGATPECTPDEVRCGEACVRISEDPEHCGGCGIPCNVDEHCVAGVCSSGGCPIGYTDCGGHCVDPETSGGHCGGCGNDCEAGTGCVDGTCRASISIDPSGVDCEGSPPVFFPGLPEGRDQCAGAVAERAFRWALCSCGDVDVSDPLITDTFDSGLDPDDLGSLGGAVGANGAFTSLSEFDISGSLWAASSGGITTDDASSVGQDLRSGGDLDGRNPLTIGGDAWVSGDVTTTSSIDIEGVLRQPEGGDRSEGVSSDGLITEPVVVEPPCSCESSDLVPVAAIVAAAASSNDNEAVGLDPSALVDVSEPLRLDLPCGRYVLDGVETDSSITIGIHGRTAIFIDGDIVVDGGRFDFVVQPGAELDVFVTGKIAVDGRFSFGSRSRPAASRLYVGSSAVDAVTFFHDTVFNGFLYAGEGTIDVRHPFEIFGGIFAGDFDSSGETTIHFDRAILRAGNDCDPPTGTCSRCGGCPSNQACVDGACGECETSDDCCPPLFCAGGVCLLLG
jgi:hypothetical protein